jgi:hypothetical protein
MFLLLTGFIALMDQAHLLSWGHAWPLYLILWGVLALAERASVAQDDMPPPPPGYMGGYQAGSGYPGGYQGGYPAGYQGGPVPPASAAPAENPGTSIVPAHGDEIEHRDSGRGSNGGGQS